MRSDLAELWRFRELLGAMVERELRIRYKNSVLGFLWSFINPLVTVLVLTFVFRELLRNGTDNYSAYVLAAYIPFMFLNFAVLDSAQSVLVSLPIVKKVYFPREILPLASVIANFVHFLLALVVFFVFLFVVWANSGFSVSPFTWRIAALPILLIVTFALALGVSFLVSALNVFYEDVKYVVSVALYLAFFLTPVMYFSENVYYRFSDKGPWGEAVYTLFHLNPVAMLATAYKKALVPPGPIDIGMPTKVQPVPFDWPLFAVACTLSFILLIAGYAVFNRLKWRFVERP